MWTAVSQSLSAAIWIDAFVFPLTEGNELLLSPFHSNFPPPSLLVLRKRSSLSSFLFSLHLHLLIRQLIITFILPFLFSTYPLLLTASIFSSASFKSEHS